MAPWKMLTLQVVEWELQGERPTADSAILENQQSQFESVGLHLHRCCQALPPKMKMNGELCWP